MSHACPESPREAARRLVVEWKAAGWRPTPEQLRLARDLVLPVAQDGR